METWPNCAQYEQADWAEHVQRENELTFAATVATLSDGGSRCTTPPEQSIIARQRWFRYWPPQITQRGYVWTRRFKRPPGRDTGRPLARLPAPDLLRLRRKDFRGGPTRDLHVGPNQTAGPTAWPNRIYANFVAKTARLDAKARSRARAAGGCKCHARGFRTPYRCLSP
jgi:hypothetical protein